MKHKRYIDYLRVISMCAVVMMHVCVTAMSEFSDGMGTMKGALFCGVKNILNFAVPVFFMITGALLLNPEKDISLQKLLKSYILKYACVILTFCWAYSLIEIIFNNHNLRPIYFLWSFADMLQGKTWDHMWYMYSLLGVLFALPILRWIAKMARGKDIIYLMVILGAFLSVLPFVEEMTGFRLGIVFPITADTFLLLLLGYWSDQEIIHLKNSLIVAIIIGSVVILGFAAYFQIIRDINLVYISRYGSPILIVYSLAIFVLIRKVGMKESLKQCRMSQKTVFLERLSIP